MKRLKKEIKKGLEEMEENINVLEDYLFSGLSFSTFKFDDASLLACKCYLMRFEFFKKKYYRALHQLFSGTNIDDLDYRKEKYYIAQIVKALKNSSILISEDPKEIKIYKKIRKNANSITSNDLSIDDLPIETKNKKACLIVEKDEDRMKYQDIINEFRNIHFIVLDKIEDESFIYDQIKVKILQDESDIYFVGKSFYANYIANSIYDVNLIAIHL